MKSSPSTKLAGSSLIAWLAVSFVCRAYPMYVIRPFGRHGLPELAAALALLQIRPPVMGVCVILALAALAWYWRAQPQRPRRILAAVGAILVCTFAVLAHVNVFELMFHPDKQPSFSAAQQAGIDPDDKVMAITIGGEAHATPSAASPTITSSTILSAACRLSRPIERYATPVWCGTGRPKVWY